MQKAVLEIGLVKREIDKKPKAHVISNTHWDREWRFAFQESRFMLTRMMRGIMDMLEQNPAYQAFLLDGQVVPVEDYLDIYPEDEPRIRKLVEVGKIQIGPWYTLPDQMRVDGECLMRNLNRGMRLADSYGGAMRIGYTIFSLGQISQLPQIYAGFGMDVIFFSKSVSHKRAPKSEFIWRSPDGTEALTSRFGKHGRANFHMEAHLPVLFGADYLSSDWKYDLKRKEFPFHMADEKGVYNEYLALKPDLKIHPEKLKEAYIETLKTTGDTLMPDERLFMDGSDYTFANSLTADVISELNDVQDETELVHSSLVDYVSSMKKKLVKENLEIVEGEMRDGMPQDVQVSILSACIPVRLHNRRVEHDVLRMAEPLCVGAWMSGLDYPKPFLDKVWKNLLLTHPHDSINGSIYDKSIRDVHSRLDQAEELAEVLSCDAIAGILTQIKRDRLSEDALHMAVFNTLPYERSALITANIDVPVEWKASDILIEDPSGNSIEFQVSDRQSLSVAMQRECGRPMPIEIERWKVHFFAENLPATGYRTYKITAKEIEKVKFVFWKPMRASTGSLFTDIDTMENKYLKVTLNNDGSFDLESKVTGHKFDNLNIFQDDGDVGDFWAMKFPLSNRTITSKGAHAVIEKIEDGPLRACVRITLTLNVPARADYNKSSRSSEEVPLSICSELHLNCNGQSLEVTTRLNNLARDHRIQVLFPTNINSDTVDACGQFDVLTRPVGSLNEDGLIQPELASKPQLHFVDISNGSKGLAVLNTGLSEYEVNDTPSRTLSLTLLRCVRSLICTEFRVGTERPQDRGSQCLGEHTFRYAIYPHAGNWDQAEVWQEAEMFAVGPRVAEFGTGGGEGILELEQSFLKVSKNIRVSAVKQSDDGKALIVRLFNPAIENRQATITCFCQIKSAETVNLLEEKQIELSVAGQNIEVDVPAKKIVTVKLLMK